MTAQNVAPPSFLAVMVYSPASNMELFGTFSENTSPSDVASDPDFTGLPSLNHVTSVEPCQK